MHSNMQQHVATRMETTRGSVLTFQACDESLLRAFTFLTDMRKSS